MKKVIQRRLNYLSTGIKDCPCCGKTLPLDKFYKREKDGLLRTNCKECTYLIKRHGPNFNKERRNEYFERKKEYSKEYRRRAEYHKSDKTKDTLLKTKYKITLDQFKEKQLNQNYSCYICEEKGKLNVDHCHKTGKVRELLCTKCNLVLGMVKEKKETLYKIILYIEKYNE